MGRLREGFAAIWKIIVLALVLDAIYQLIELGTFYPGEATIVAILLAFIPIALVASNASHRDVTVVR